MKKFIINSLTFVIISLLLIILLELSFNFLKVPKISHHNINSKAQNIMPYLDSNSILFIGDSRIEWGIKPKLIQNSYGEVINLAFPGSNGLDILTYLIDNKIYPKAVIIGFTPNHYRYNNHNLDKIRLSYKNRKTESLKYFLLQNSFIYDKESIKLNMRKEKPYFIYHKYDNRGGVMVLENGNYDERKSYQKKMYKVWSDEFNRENYLYYLDNLTDLINKFKQKSKIFGLYMPVSNEIFELEKENYNRNDIARAFDYYFDFSSLLSTEDSLGKGEYYFYDGSHLNPHYAIRFTKMLNVELKARTLKRRMAKKWVQ